MRSLNATSTAASTTETVRPPLPPESHEILAHVHALIKQQSTESPGKHLSYAELKAALIHKFGVDRLLEAQGSIQDILAQAGSDIQSGDSHIDVVLLFDVDETLAISQNSLCPYTYNAPLMEAWQRTLEALPKKSVRCCSFLFTSQVLCTPAFVFQPADEPHSEPSRVKLRMHLRDTYGIRVPAVITSFDPYYDPDLNKRIGAYYRDNIEPFERRIQTGQAIAFDDAELTQKKICEKKLSLARHKQRVAEMEKQSKEAEEAEGKGKVTPPTRRKKKRNIFSTNKRHGPKQPMMRYLMGHLVKGGFINKDRCTKIIMVDDRTDVLAAVERACSKDRYPSIRYMGLLAKKGQTRDDYATKIYSFLKSEFQSLSRLTEVARKMRTELHKSYGPLWRRRHDCFSAKNAVDYLVDTGHAICTAAAVGFCTALLDHDIIAAVEDCDRYAAFECNKKLYRVILI